MSAWAILLALREGLNKAGLPPGAIQSPPGESREAVGMMLEGLEGCIDVLVPRGGKSLVGRVAAEARVPVLGHLEGVCHVYVHADSDLEMARRIVLDSKMRRTGICGAAETLLIDQAVIGTHLRPLVVALLEAGCEVRGDETARSVDPRVRAASPQESWGKEFLDAIVAVRGGARSR